MRGAIAIAVYVVVGFLTFGHVFNANYVEPTPVEQCGAKPNILDDRPGWDKWYDCTHPDWRMHTTLGASFPAMLAGAAWPVYWGGKLAIKVTK